MITFLLLLLLVFIPLLFLVDFVTRNRSQQNESLLIDNADLIRAIRNDEGVQTINNALLIQIMRKKGTLICPPSKLSVL